MYKKLGLCIFCLSVLLFCLLTIAHFVLFLSSYSYLKHVIKSNKLSPSLENNDTVLASIIKNMALLMLFVAQHSLQANANFKRFLHQQGFGVVERLLYIIGTCITLQILMFYWQPISKVTLWAIPTQNNVAVWWYFTIIHSLCWMAMYSVCFILDISDFFGAKQVYYYCLDWPPPDRYKSENLKRLYSHIRHVNFSPLIIILIIHPVMQLDRVLISYIFIMYMILGFKVDNEDHFYQRRMFKRKIRELYSNLGGIPPSSPLQ